MYVVVAGKKKSRYSSNRELGSYCDPKVEEEKEMVIWLGNPPGTTDDCVRAPTVHAYIVGGFTICVDQIRFFRMSGDHNWRPPAS